ncbi:MAG: 2-dehydropantoate 2-reductase [Desulfobacterales bacterium]
MRIAIIGAGAMGSIFGAMLSAVADVALVDNFERHVRAIRGNGLEIELNDGSIKNQAVFATARPEEVAPGVDLAIIFTKSYDTRQAAETARDLLAEKGIALTLQNGIGNLDVIAGVVGENRCAAGVTSHGGTLVHPGRVRHAGEGPTYIAAPSAAVDLGPVADVFTRAGIDVSLSGNLDTLIWGKLVINVGINALAAIVRVPNGILGITGECKAILAEAVAEAVQVAQALGIALPYDDPLAHVLAVCEKTAKNRASMLQDTLRGVRTEIGVINQAIVEKGVELGVATPCNRFLTATVLALEATAAQRI